MPTSTKLTVFAPQRAVGRIQKRCLVKVISFSHKRKEKDNNGKVGS